MASEPTTDRYDPDDRLQEAITCFEEARDAGRDPDPEEWLRRYPEVAVRLKDFFERAGRMRRLAAAVQLPPRERIPHLKDYEMLGEVSRGAMGVVYRARHVPLDRLVAIKLLLPDSSAERFVREARLLARIKSAYVVAVHDFEILPGGCPMLVMEWVEGTDMRRLLALRSEPLPETQALTWMQQTCEGMRAAAEQGIIHRDLKPSNLLIDGQGCARVADFGLARGPAVLDDLSLTGAVMGSPYYMAPEQAEDAHGVDTRADIYSFGATFYHALTGRPPFDGATAFAVLYKHKTEPLISPRAYNPALSERTSEILERCLAKAPAERFSSFAEILNQLRPGGEVSSPWAAADDAELGAYLARYRSRRDSILANRTAWNEDLEVCSFPRGQTLRIVRGDIVAQQVDVLVSADNCYLPMKWGVSLALNRAAGPEVAAQAARLRPARPGRAVVTSAGNLPARFIFHGVTVGLLGGEVVRPSRDLIAEIMASCFYHADSHDVRSIAFPLLGTGVQQFPRDVCLDTMFHFLARMFLRGLTCVREARVILFD
jgi:serine/threonine protein kinase/O-acetyl-ADP-ribose deacetylase (regulator of RNase III)